MITLRCIGDEHGAAVLLPLLLPLSQPLFASGPGSCLHQSYKQGENLVLFLSLPTQEPLFLSGQPKPSRQGAGQGTSRTRLLFLLLPTFPVAC